MNSLINNAADMMKRRKVIIGCLILFLLVLYKYFIANELPSPNQVVGRRNTLGTVDLFTLNIWFGDHQTVKRMAILGKMIDKLRPSIITFQEVTNKNIQYLKNQKWFSRYTMIPKQPQGGYGVVILTVFPVNNWRSIPFRTSKMGRNLLLAELKAKVDQKSGQLLQFPWQSHSSPVKYVNFTVATSHLESMAYSSIEREKQLQHSLDVLNIYNDVCLMGDLNLELKVDGEIQLQSNWLDAWMSIKNHTHNNGMTWDPDNNSNIKLSEPDSTPDRFDRVICKLLNFNIDSVHIIGRKPIDGVFVSDHYALLTRLKLFTPGKKLKHIKNVKKTMFLRPKNWEKFAVST